MKFRDSLENTMAQEGTWADERCIKSLSLELGHDILCLSYSPNFKQFYVVQTDNGFVDKPIIPALYNGQNHYDLLEEVWLGSTNLVDKARLRTALKTVHGSVRIFQVGEPQAPEEEGDLQKKQRGRKRKAEDRKSF